MIFMIIIINFKIKIKVGIAPAIYLAAHIIGMIAITPCLSA